jgi:hypothetical protein
MRKISGPWRKKTREGWRKLHDEELNNLYSLALLSSLQNQGGSDEQDKWHTRDTGNTYRDFGGET